MEQLEKFTDEECAGAYSMSSEKHTTDELEEFVDDHFNFFTKRIVVHAVWKGEKYRSVVERVKAVDMKFVYTTYKDGSFLFTSTHKSYGAIKDRIIGSIISEHLKWIKIEILNDVKS